MQRRPSPAARKERINIEKERARLLDRVGSPVDTSFSIDDFQREAVSQVAAGIDTLVVAPTGAGKTFIALQAIEATIGMGARSVYTTPLKALSNTKYTELKKVFEPRVKVGLLTGDRKIDGDASVVVATTEIYRNELYQDSSRYGLVVLDEVHFISDQQRGAVWEESIILTPKASTLLMLSASISNAAEVSGWISEVRGKPCKIVIKRERPVELRLGFLHPDIGVVPLNDEEGNVFEPVTRYYENSTLDAAGMRLKPSRGGGDDRFGKRRFDRTHRESGGSMRNGPQRSKRRSQSVLYGEFPIRKVLYFLEKDNLLPGILLRSARRQCDLDIEQVAKTKAAYLSPSQSERLVQVVDEIIAQYGIEADIIRNHVQYQALIHTGVGAHHAGQLLIWRLVLEELMSRGLLRLLVATGTVAAGVDFPARSVVVTAHSKRGNDGFQTLQSSEFQQMSGRAGRRGKDSVGICLIAPGPYCDARVLQQVAKQPPEPLRSQYFASPSTVLNLLEFRNVDDLKYTVEKSFAAYTDRRLAKIIFDEAGLREHDAADDANLPAETRKRIHKRVRRLRKEANTLETRQEELLNRTLEGLRKLGYIEGSGLSEKGDWAAELCTSLMLELGEAINDGLFDDVTETELVGLVACISGDAHRTYFGLKPNPLKKDQLRHLERITVRVKDAQATAAATEVQVVPNAGLTAITWLETEGWLEFSSLLRLSGVAEGDAARLITQTADHLNQISRLDESHPELARMAYEARLKLMRPPLSESLAVYG